MPLVEISDGYWIQSAFIEKVTTGSSRCGGRTAFKVSVLTKDGEKHTTLYETKEPARQMAEKIVQAVNSIPSQSDDPKSS